MKGAYFDKISFTWSLLRPHLFLNAALWLTKYYVNLQVQLKLMDQLTLGRNSFFGAPSCLSLIPRFAPLLHLATLGLRKGATLCIKIKHSGLQKMNFPLFLYLLVNKELCTGPYFFMQLPSIQCTTETKVRPKFRPKYRPIFRFGFGSANFKSFGRNAYSKIIAKFRMKMTKN